MASTFVSAPELPVLASAPASPVAGTTYVRLSDYHVLVYNGSTWVDQAVGTTNFKQSVFLEITADTTTTSGSFVDLLSQTITTGANFLIVDFSASFSNSQGLGIYQSVEFQMLIDGVAKRGGGVLVTAGVEYCAALVFRQAVSAAVHTVKIQWRTTGATARCRPVTTVLEHAGFVLTEVVT